MRYDFREGIKLDKKRPKWPLWLMLIVGLAGGAYYAANNMAPQLVSMPLSAKSSADATMRLMQATEPAKDAHLYIPQLNVDLSIDEAPAPDKKEVITVRGMYFKLGATPWDTREQSVFYNLDKLSVGDEVYLDHQSKRYAFVIKETNRTAADDVQATDKSKLILVPVDDAGQTAKSSIVVAELKGIVQS